MASRRTRAAVADGKARVVDVGGMRVEVLDGKTRMADIVTWVVSNISRTTPTGPAPCDMAVEYLRCCRENVAFRESFMLDSMKTMLRKAETDEAKSTEDWDGRGEYDLLKAIAEGAS